MKAGVEGKEAAGLKRRTALKWGWHPSTGMACSADQRVNQKCVMRVDCSVGTVRGLTVCEKAAFPLVETAGSVGGSMLGGKMVSGISFSPILQSLRIVHRGGG